MPKILVFFPGLGRGPYTREKKQRVIEALAKFALQAKFDDSGVGSVSRKRAPGLGLQPYTRGLNDITPRWG